MQIAYVHKQHKVFNSKYPQKLAFDRLLGCKMSDFHNDLFPEVSSPVLYRVQVPGAGLLQCSGQQLCITSSLYEMTYCLWEQDIC